MNMDLYLPIYKILNKYQNQYLSKEFIFKECVSFIKKNKVVHIDFNDDFQKFFLLHLLTINDKYNFIHIKEDENNNIDSLILLPNDNYLFDQKYINDSEDEGYNGEEDNDNDEDYEQEPEKKEEEDDEENDDSDEDYKEEKNDEENDDSDEDYKQEENNEENDDSDEDYKEEEDDDSDEDYKEEENNEEDDDSDEDYKEEENNEEDDDSDEDYKQEENDEEDEEDDEEDYEEEEDDEIELGFYNINDIIEFGVENKNNNIFINTILYSRDHHHNNFMHMIFKLNNKNLIDTFLVETNFYLLYEKNDEGMTPLDYMSNKTLKVIIKKNIEKTDHLEEILGDIINVNENNYKKLENKISNYENMLNFFILTTICITTRLFI